MTQQTYRSALLATSALGSAAGHHTGDYLVQSDCDARGFHDLAGNGINGRALMDQASHQGLQIPLGASVTTAVASLLGGDRR